ncbi:TPA: hypothetical protein HA265_06830 [Candidatus Woesearchaeota archaeon]|nr:hypothetical protein [Candidatus Woesearchaeota archaeon]
MKKESDIGKINVFRDKRAEETAMWKVIAVLVLTLAGLLLFFIIRKSLYGVLK